MIGRASTTHDQYRRPWGVPLWPGGPINGGRDHAQFVAATMRDAETQYRIDSEPDCTPSPAPNRRAALQYIWRAFGGDRHPVAAVERILEGQAVRVPPAPQAARVLPHVEWELP